MDYFFKRFKDEAGSMLEPLGFKFKKRCFNIRVTEEKVFQYLELNRRWVPGLRFMSRPLFMGKVACLLSDGTWVRKQWSHYQKSEEMQDVIILEMTEYIKNELIPFFEKTKTIEGAYQAEIDGHNMGQEFFVASYKAQRGDCVSIIEHYERWIEDSEDAERENLIFFRKNGTSTEEEMQQYSENMEKQRTQARERIGFFSNGSPEAIAKYFKAHEEEAFEELKVKWKFKL
jgi:hypothetical protein